MALLILALLAAAAAPRRAWAARDSSEVGTELAALEVERAASAGGGSTTPAPGSPTEEEEPETLIFVDVDGVLNIAIANPDRPGAPVLFGIPALTHAKAIWSERNAPGRRRPENVDLWDRIMAVSKRKVDHGDDWNYEKVVSNLMSLTDLYVQRLAQIIKAAGHGAKVVLSSSWRQPAHVGERKKLEQALARHLNVGRFRFHARTKLDEKLSPEGRVKCVGDYVQEHSSGSGGSSSSSSNRELRILMLDDFVVTPLDGWELDNGQRVHSPRDVENYLVSRVRNRRPTAAKFVHTYDEWNAEEGEGDGLWVRIGCGLTAANYHQAMRFLGWEPEGQTVGCLGILGAWVPNPVQMVWNALGWSDT